MLDPVLVEFQHLSTVCGNQHGQTSETVTGHLWPLAGKKCSDLQLLYFEVWMIWMQDSHDWLRFVFWNMNLIIDMYINVHVHNIYSIYIYLYILHCILQHIHFFHKHTENCFLVGNMLGLQCFWLGAAKDVGTRLWWQFFGVPSTSSNHGFSVSNFHVNVSGRNAHY